MSQERFDTHWKGWHMINNLRSFYQLRKYEHKHSVKMVLQFLQYHFNSMFMYIFFHLIKASVRSKCFVYHMLSFLYVSRIFPKTYSPFAVRVILSIIPILTPEKDFNITDMKFVQVKMKDWSLQPEQWLSLAIKWDLLIRLCWSIFSGW